MKRENERKEKESEGKRRRKNYVRENVIECKLKALLYEFTCE